MSYSMLVAGHIRNSRLSSAEARRVFRIRTLCPP